MSRIDKSSDIKKNKKKIGPAVLTVIILVIIVIGVAGFFFVRIKMLDNNLKAGNECLQEEQYQDAITAFESALKLYPTSADAYLGITKAYIGLGELEKAMDILEQGIAKTGSENLEASKDLVYDQVFATYVLNYNYLNLLSGESKQLTVTPRSKDFGFQVVFSSSDDSIATVTEDGFIMAKADGDADIIANIGNDTWGYRDISCDLTVGVIVTYFEEKGCEYKTDKDTFEMPMFVFQVDENGDDLEGGTLEIAEDEKTVYSINNITVSDPDAEGNVTYEIEVDAKAIATLGIVDGSKEKDNYWYYDYDAADILIADEYTGKIFIWQDLYGYENTVIESEVEYNEKTYHVFGEKTEEWTEGEDWETNREGEIRWATRTDEGKINYALTVPKEYEGLVLLFDNKGQTVRKIINEDVSDIDFDTARDDGSNREAEDIKVVRLSDYIEH